MSRRDFFVHLAAVLPAMGMAGHVFGLASPQADRNGISHTCESIHQEVVFKALRKRVYEALTNSKRFAQVTDFVMKGASAEISADAGGAFSLILRGEVPTERTGSRHETDFRSHGIPGRCCRAPCAGMVVALLGATPEVSGVKQHTSLLDRYLGS
jgi:hypothetical protein